MGAVSLTQVQQSLGLFAEAIVGAPVEIQVLDEDRLGWPWDRGLGRAATSVGADPHEPVSIRLPAELTTFDDPAHNRALFRAQVLQQLGFVEFGTFDDDGLDHDDDEGRAPARRGPADHPLIAATSHPNLVLHLFERFEELRVTAAVRRRYPGIGPDLDRCQAVARHDRVGRRGARDDAVEMLERRCLGSPLAEVAALARRPRRPSAVRVLELIPAIEHPGASRDDAVRSAIEIADLLIGPDRPAPQGEGRPLVVEVEPEDAAGDPVETDEPGGTSFDPGSPEAEAETISDDLAGAVQTGPIDQADDLDVVRRDDEPREPSIGGPAPKRATPAGAKTFFYDEWDYRRGDHRPSWCRVVEERLHGEDHAFIGDVRDRHAELGARVRRQFARLRPEERVRVHRRNDGDELDLDAVIEAIVDRRSGHHVDERLDIRRDRAARDVATAFLIDLSASTSSPVDPPGDEPVSVDEEDDGFEIWGAEPVPRPPERRVIDVAKDAVALMCDALERLGDQHGVYGFSGKGRHQVDFCVAKEFGDRTSPVTWSALAAMKPLAYTRMGPAIRHATAKFAAQEARTKLLIVISDGYPQDIDYGPDRRDKSYGVNDTARALADAQRAGIDTFCVTIDPAGHDYLRTMCPDHRYLVIDEVASLPAELAKLYLALSAR